MIGTKGVSRAKMRNAGKLVAYTVKTGKMEKPDRCEACGKVIDDPSQLDGHHVDYDEACVVKWFCKPCHKKLHKELRQLDRIERDSGLAEPVALFDDYED